MALDTESDGPFALWAEILAPLIRLHDREVDAEVLAGLWQSGYAELLAEVVSGEESLAAARGFGRVLAGLPRPAPAALLDELAVDFADGYLNHGFRAAPSGSVWMTEDHLERQEPMFEVRDWYAHYGLSVPDWRLRSDDHIVHELQFVSHLLRTGTEGALLDAAVFLDTQVLPWVPDFCQRIALRARHPFHAGVALATRAVLQSLRADLAVVTGREPQVLPHAWAVEESRAERQAQADIERPFVPGTGEGW